MLLKLPVLYEASALRKKHRLHSTARFVALEDFEIEEVSGEDAPVALDGFDLPLGEAAGFTRWFDESHWQPERKTRALLTPGEWAEKLLDPDCGFRGWMQYVKSADQFARIKSYAGGYITELDATEFRDVRNSTLEAERATLGDFVRNVRVIDGAVYCRSGPPVYVLNHKANPVSVKIGFGNVKTEDVDLFRIDRREDMLLHAAEHFADRAIEAGSEPRILVDGAFDYPDEERTLLHRSSHLCKLLENWLKELDEHQGAAWFHLRAAVRRMSKDPSDESGEDLARNLGALRATLEAPSDELEKHLRSILGRAQMEADRLLSRWDLRPVAIDAERLPQFA